MESGEPDIFQVLPGLQLSSLLHDQTNACKSPCWTCIPTRWRHICCPWIQRTFSIIYGNSIKCNYSIVTERGVEYATYPTGFLATKHLKFQELNETKQINKNQQQEQQKRHILQPWMCFLTRSVGQKVGLRLIY